MKLARAQNSSPDIAKIRGDAGEILSEEELEKHVTKFYRNLYSLPENGRNVSEQDINNFLGPISNLEPVQNSKLNQNEKVELDSPLTLQEFDKAIKQCNKKSAPGTDGLNNKFIAHFWQFFRVPLFNYANCCYENGELTPSFKTAKIRLIPKKGDHKKIANWRPISLLNCFYKLISRVLTNRLKKVIDKVTSIGQYGYSKKKQCQEVLFGLLNKIHQINSNGIEGGALVSLDIKKAFDSISHNFMEHALKFFNFGEQFIKWIKVLCTNREACVIMTGNKLGKNFKLSRGNAQGDTISPFLFNICYQLLLFKLEYDLQIKDLRIPVPVQKSPLYSSGIPVSTHSNKVFTFADDCNVLCSRDPITLARLKSVLLEFEQLSGLECNIDKSHILIVGPDPGNHEDITELGFGVKKSLTVLGMKVSNCFDTDKVENAAAITRKISENISKWSRFMLSLPGRIQIAKTMLYSQINYLGCFLDFSEIILGDWENMICDFVVGNLKTGKNKVFTPVSNGGLGLFRLNSFLGSQKIRWVVYASRNLDSFWKVLLSKATIKDFYRYDVGYANFTPPIVSGLVGSFFMFKKKFFEYKNNYRKATIFGEPLLTVGTRSRDFFQLEDLDLILDLDVRKKLTEIKVWEMMDGNIVKNKQSIEQFCGGPVPTQVYNKVKKICLTAQTRYHRDIQVLGVDLNTFFNSWSGGSRKFRNILEYTESYVSHNTVKFALANEIVISVDCSVPLNRDWTKSSLSNELRTFIFKLVNNLLKTNTMVSHFARGVSRNCTFCEISRNPEPVDESTFHLFFDCPVTENIRFSFFTWLTENPNFNLSRHEFFCCGPVQPRCEVWTTILYLVKFAIWECKKRKTLPVLDYIKEFVKSEINVIQKLNVSFRNKLSTYRWHALLLQNDV
jgi:hypothetical protein